MFHELVLVVFAAEMKSMFLEQNLEQSMFLEHQKSVF